MLPTTMFDSKRSDSTDTTNQEIFRQAIFGLLSLVWFDTSVANNGFFNACHFGSSSYLSLRQRQVWGEHLW